MMVPKEGCGELIEALRNGLYYVIIQYRALEMSRQDVITLMIVNQFDQDTGLAETEIQIRIRMKNALSITCFPIGMTQGAFSISTMARAAGGSWDPAAYDHFVKFAKSVGDPQLEFLDTAWATHVDVDNIRVSTEDFERASKIDPTCPWIQVVRLICQCLSPLKTSIAGPMCVVGAQTYPAAFIKITAAPTAALRPIETWFREVVNQAWEGDACIALDTSHVSFEIVGLCARLGNKLLRTESWTPYRHQR